MTKQVATQIVLLCLATAFLVAADEPSEASWQTIIDGTYKVMLRCPADWKPVPGHDIAAAMGPERGGLGFVLDAEGGESNTAQQLCEGTATHVLQPFGTSPTIRPMMVQGQSACLVWPSKDQMGDHDAQLIVKSPQPVKIGDTVYSFLTLDADKDYITAMIRSLKFLELDPQNAPFLMEIGLDDSEGGASVTTVGAPVMITVTLRNNSDRALRIPFSDAITDYRFNVSNERYVRMPVTGKYQQLEREQKTAPSVAEPVMVNPHSVYHTQVEISSLRQFPYPGTYTIRGQMKLPAEFGPGLVNSNTLAVIVVAGEKKEPQSNQPHPQQPSAASPQN